MEQKKFKSFRSAIIQEYDAGVNKIRVEETAGHFDVYINDDIVETFKTKFTALKIAEETAKDIGTNK